MDDYEYSIQEAKKEYMETGDFFYLNLLRMEGSSLWLLLL